MKEITDLKILHVFNRANLPYYLVKGLRKNGVNADLIYSTVEAKNSKASDPLNENQNNEDWLIKWDGDSLHPFSNKKLFLNLIRTARKYDIIHCHYPSSLFLQFIFKPFVIHETGWIRVVPTRNLFVDRLMKWSFKKANCVIMTNPDCYSILESMKYKKESFLPFGIDTDFYKPTKNDSVENLFICPNRQHWMYKGIDKLLEAFGKFAKENKDAKLILIKFGIDLEKSIDLINKLDISKNIIWYDFLDKQKLIELYHKSVGVFDQFNVGSYGYVGVEAMSCGKPLVMHLDNNYFSRSFNDSPPNIEAETVDDIYNSMNLLKDKNTQIKYSVKSREFALKHHSLDSVTKKCIKIYEQIN